MSWAGKPPGPVVSDGFNEQLKDDDTTIIRGWRWIMLSEMDEPEYLVNCLAVVFRKELGAVSAVQMGGGGRCWGLRAQGMRFTPDPKR
jgi:hypothetical protein